MRLYLDTNILFFMLQRQEENIDRAVKDMICDFSNQLYTSALCVAELMQLSKTRAGKLKRGKAYQGSVTEWLRENDIQIIYLSPAHLAQLEQIPLPDNHHDVIDRLIIAQAITDKATMVSSDLKFAQYRQYGLQLHENKR